MSGSYKINGVEILLQPTTGRWIPRQTLGIDGNGRAIYPALRQFELNWQLGSQADFDDLLTYFESLTVTGSLVVDLPKWDNSVYVFESYTGCLIREPEAGPYFTQNKLAIRMLITNIRTG